MARLHPLHVERMGRICLFQGLSKRELRELTRHAEEHHVREGTDIVMEDTPGRALFVIVEGDARVLRKGRTLARLGPGDHFGEIALLDNLPRSATVRADTDMQLLVLDKRAFVQAVEQSPKIAVNLLSTLGQRIRAANAKIWDHSALAAE